MFKGSCYIVAKFLSNSMALLEAKGWVSVALFCVATE